MRKNVNWEDEKMEPMSPVNDGMVIVGDEEDVSDQLFLEDFKSAVDEQGSKDNSLTGKNKWQQDEWNEDISTHEKGARKKKRGKTVNKGNSEVITMSGNVSTNSFVILEEGNKGAKIVGMSIKYALMAALFLGLIYLTFIMMSYRFVPEDIRGTETKIFGFSMISRDYQLPLDELKDGDLVIVSKSFNWSPIVYDYDIYIYRSHNGNIIFVTGMNGLSKRLEFSDISYSLIGQPRY